MYMQVPSWAGKEDEVGKMTDVSAIVPLLQAIFAILQAWGGPGWYFPPERTNFVRRKFSLSQKVLKNMR